MNSVEFLSEANTMTQQEAPVTVVRLWTGSCDAGLHIPQTANGVSVMGQEAMTTGRPTLNTKNIAATNVAAVRYVENTVMR